MKKLAPDNRSTQMVKPAFEKGMRIGRAVPFLLEVIHHRMRKGHPGTAPTAARSTQIKRDPRRSARGPAPRRLILVLVVSVLASLAVTASASAATLFTNSNPITIRDNNTASPYPSEIAVSGMTGPITDVTVTLHRFGHNLPEDVDILLVSPSGKGVVLMSDACGTTNIEDFTWTFTQSAPGPMSGDCANFTYRPTNIGSGDTWPSPAPQSYFSSLDAFDEEQANGVWRLYVFDDVASVSGDIEGGWSISIETGPVDMAIPPTGTSGLAYPYPATRPISGQTGIISDLNVTIDGIWHQNPDDLDLLLVGPEGQKVVLMSDACGSYGVNAYGWVWDDEAPALMPDGDGTNACGTRFHRPADYEAGETWHVPAPPQPYSATLSAFDGTDPNGLWLLFVNDDAAGGTGFFTNRFQLGFTTIPDTTAPTVSSTTPSAGATGVPLNTSPTATFSEQMDPATITTSTFQLYKGQYVRKKKKKGKKRRWVLQWVPVNASVSYHYDTALKTATLDPASDLAANSKYLAVVTTGAKDNDGNALSQNHYWTFTTGTS